jgi:aspartate aminotransferase
VNGSAWGYEFNIQHSTFIIHHSPFTIHRNLVFLSFDIYFCPMKLSNLAETLIGSEIVKLGGDIREKIRRGEKIYNFTVGDFDPAIFPIPKALEEEIISAYRQHFTNYPAAEGNLDLREAISHFIKERERLHFTTEEILVGCGGRPLIHALYYTVCDKGDKVIYAAPSWNNNHYTHFVGGEHIVVEARAENNFMPTVDEIRPYIKDATLLSLCSPQNPTGTTFTKRDLEAICDLVLQENATRQATRQKIVRSLRPDVLASHLRKY